MASTPGLRRICLDDFIDGVELRGAGRAWVVWASRRHCAGLAEAACRLEVSMASTMIAFCRDWCLVSMSLACIPGKSCHEMKTQPMHVAVVLTREVVNALQKVSPLRRAGLGKSTLLLPRRRGKYGSKATKAYALHWSRDFRPSGSIS